MINKYLYEAYNNIQEVWKQINDENNKKEAYKEVLYDLYDRIVDTEEFLLNEAKKNGLEYVIENKLSGVEKIAITNKRLIVEYKDKKIPRYITCSQEPINIKGVSVYYKHK